MDDVLTFDAFEALSLMKEGIHKADLYLTALSKHEGFDPDKIRRHSDWVKNVRAGANVRLMGVQLKKLNGERLGNIPFGYLLADDLKHIIPEPEDQLIAAVALRLRNGGRSLCSVASGLNAKDTTPGVERHGTTSTSEIY